MLAAVYERSQPLLPARVVASTSLLRAGLERAARNAGLTPVASGEPAVITLHCDANTPCDAPVVVRAELDRVTLTIASDPGPEAWAALTALTRELLNEPRARPNRA